MGRALLLIVLFFSSFTAMAVTQMQVIFKHVPSNVDINRAIFTTKMSYTPPGSPKGSWASFIASENSHYTVTDKSVFYDNQSAKGYTLSQLPGASFFLTFWDSASHPYQCSELNYFAPPTTIVVTYHHGLFHDPSLTCKW